MISACGTPCVSGYERQHHRGERRPHLRDEAEQAGDDAERER
jgi:hypothetical protein